MPELKSGKNLRCPGYMKALQETYASSFKNVSKISKPTYRIFKTLPKVEFYPADQNLIIIKIGVTKARF